MANNILNHSLILYIIIYICTAGAFYCYLQYIAKDKRTETNFYGYCGIVSVLLSGIIFLAIRLEFTNLMDLRGTTWIDIVSKDLYEFTILVVFIIIAIELSTIALKKFFDWKVERVAANPNKEKKETKLGALISKIQKLRHAYHCVLLQNELFQFLMLGFIRLRIGTSLIASMYNIFETRLGLFGIVLKFIPILLAALSVHIESLLVKQIFIILIIIMTIINIVYSGLCAIVYINFEKAIAIIKQKNPEEEQISGYDIIVEIYKYSNVNLEDELKRQCYNN
jgi:hypothetical protein